MLFVVISLCEGIQLTALLGDFSNWTGKNNW